MLKRLVGLAVLAMALAAPAFAQTAGETCQKLTQEFRAAGVPVSQQAVDVAAALEARAALAPKEAAAREGCKPGGYDWIVPIEMTKEDLDIALGRAVPGCKAFIDQASPYVSSAQHARSDPQKALMMIDALVRLRSEAAEPCRDYPGVMGRMYRAELMMTMSLPPAKEAGSKPQ
jgi:hypothetical protein